MAIKQENIILTEETDSDKFSSTDNITNVIGIGDNITTALRDHIVSVILYYEDRLKIYLKSYGDK